MLKTCDTKRFSSPQFSRPDFPPRLPQPVAAAARLEVHAARIGRKRPAPMISLPRRPETPGLVRPSQARMRGHAGRPDPGRPGARPASRRPTRSQGRAARSIRPAHRRRSRFPAPPSPRRPSPAAAPTTTTHARARCTVRAPCFAPGRSVKTGRSRCGVGSAEAGVGSGPFWRRRRGRGGERAHWVANWCDRL